MQPKQKALIFCWSACVTLAVTGSRARSCRWSVGPTACSIKAKPAASAAAVHQLYHGRSSCNRQDYYTRIPIRKTTKLHATTIGRCNQADRQPLPFVVGGLTLGSFCRFVRGKNPKKAIPSNRPIDDLAYSFWGVPTQCGLGFGSTKFRVSAIDHASKC